MSRFYPFVAERARGRCEYCHAPEQVFNSVFEVEHIHPEAHGGASDYDNLALSCFACNGYKSSYVTGFDVESDAEVRLFHPRRDTWSEHFAIDDDNVVTGVTDVGRATVFRLKMNHERQRNARVYWRSSNIFP